MDYQKIMGSSLILKREKVKDLMKIESDLKKPIPQISTN